MANVKNFGLSGVGSDVQLGKAGSRLINNAGVFNFKLADGTSDASLTAASITASGNLILGSNTSKLSIDGVNVVELSSGSLPQISGNAAVKLPTGNTAARPTAAAGLLRVNNDIPTATTIEYYNGTSWITLSTGGSTATIQAQVDAIEVSLGDAINGAGVYVPTGFSGPIIGETASFTNAIQNIADYVESTDTLDEIFPSLGNGNVIYATGGRWAQAAPGATSGIQGYDADLTALAATTTTGIYVVTGSGTSATRSLVQPAAGITISDADGVAGNPTFALANDLAALEGLTTSGYIIRTGDGTATTRSIAGTSGNIVVTNGSGVSSDTNINLATVTQADTGNFVKVTLDGFGRVTGNTAVVTSDITTLVDATYVNVSGDTMSSAANLTFVGGGEVLGLPSVPSGDTAATSKAYVDAVAAGLTWKTAVLAATTGNITLSGAQTIDGVSVVAGNRVLVKSQTAPAENGIYVAANGTWTRSTDADTPSELNGAAVFVQQGTLNADTGWTQTNTIIAVGTTSVVWAQFSGSSAYVAGNGLSLTGNTFSVNVGAGIAILPANEVGIDVVSGKAVQLTGSLSASQLTFVLDEGLDGSGLEQSGDGLKISPNGVQNTMLANSAVGINGNTGTGLLSLGEEFTILGTSTQGITTSYADQTLTITASNASSSQKGVATFNTASFAVTSGDVTIKTAGVSNAQLANSSITFTGTSGSDAVALGESMAIISADSAITTTMGTNSLSIQLNTVDVPHGGTGRTTLAAGQVLFGAGTSAVGLDADLSFNDTTNTLTVGSATLQGATGGDVTITANATNANINLTPNGTGKVVIGPAAAGVITSAASESLTVIGNNTLVLTSTSGNVVMTLPDNTTDKVTVSGPSAADYATNLADADLVNKQYVDNTVSGSIKAVKATINLGATGTSNVGVALPAGATVLQVKVNVAAAGASTALLSVGKTGSVAAYMTTAENDVSTTGIYIAETYVAEGSSVQVIATVSGTVTTGTAAVIVEYQLA